MTEIKFNWHLFIVQSTGKNAYIENTQMKFHVHKKILLTESYQDRKVCLANLISMIKVNHTG